MNTITRRSVIWLALTATLAAGVILPIPRSLADDKTPPAPAEEKPIDIKDLADGYGTLGTFHGDPYVKVAIALQKLGKEKALKELARLAKQDDWPGTRVAVLCRMLFVRRPGKEFRRPMVGGTAFIGGLETADVPLEPIMLADGQPFTVVTSVIVTGATESSSAYLEYCIQECDWNPTPYKLKTPKQKKAALDKLIATTKWKGKLSESDRTLLTMQIEEPPKSAKPKE